MAMTALERQKIAQGNAFQYQAYKDEIDAYRDSASGRKRGMLDAIVSGGLPSDPTARAAIAACELPERLQYKELWVDAVDGAWAECLALDGDNKHGLAFLMEHNFHLTGKMLPREKNAENRMWIMRKCNISYSVFYARLSKITDILVYHAARNNLI